MTLHDLEHQSGFERLDEHLRRQLRHRPEHAEDAAGGVEQRHRGQGDIAVAYTRAFEDVGAVVDEAAMVEHGTLREPGGPRRVLDHHRIERIDVRKLDRGIVASGHELVPLIEPDHAAQLRAALHHLLNGCQHRVATELRDHDDAGSSGLVQHVLELTRPERRVHGHEHQSGHRCTELEDDPLRNVRCPDREALARREPLR